MRRLSRKHKERLIRQDLSVKREWKIANLRRRSAINAKKKKSRDKGKSAYVPALRYHAPKVVTIDSAEHRSELLRFFEQLRGHFKNNRDRTLVIDFTATSRFVAGGTLLLYAELNRLVTYCGGEVKLRCTEPANNRASQVLKQVGIYRLCSNKCNVNTCSSDVVHWHAVQGGVVDNSLCAPAIEGYQDRLSADMIDELLGGLGEAMTNAIHHAYDGIRRDGLEYDCGTEWWMFSQAKDGYLSVAFCDLGVGIPTTLPIKRPSLWKKVVQRLKDPTDADCIQEAIIEGRTRTSLDGRGYGLGNIIEVVENVKGGVVVVYSNRGRYDSRVDTPHPFNYSDSILGTLICWRVPMGIRHRSEQVYEN